MFDQLKEAIKQNKVSEKPTMSNWWSLLRDLENLVPPSMLFPNWKGYVKKAARIMFFREVCQDQEIKSTKDMVSGALWEIHKFLNNDDVGIENCQSVTDWYVENAQDIYVYAGIEVKPAKLKADKARRDAKKKIETNKEIPF